MTIWFSNTTETFYDDSFPNVIIPSDAVSITDDLYANVVNGIANSLIITTDDSGNPVVSNVSAIPPIRVITSYSFVNRLTPTERGMITVAAYEAISNVTSPDPTLSIFLDTLGAATIVDLDNLTVQDAIGLLEEVGLLSSDRAAAMLQDGTFDESQYGPISLD